MKKNLYIANLLVARTDDIYRMYGWFLNQINANQMPR